jgi:hypothetical protein
LNVSHVAFGYTGGFGVRCSSTGDARLGPNTRKARVEGHGSGKCGLTIIRTGKSLRLHHSFFPKDSAQFFAIFLVFIPGLAQKAILTIDEH